MSNGDWYRWKATKCRSDFSQQQIIIQAGWKQIGRNNIEACRQTNWYFTDITPEEQPDSGIHGHTGVGEIKSIQVWHSTATKKRE